MRDLLDQPASEFLISKKEILPGSPGFGSFPLVRRFPENKYATLIFDEFPDGSADVGSCRTGTEQQRCRAGM
jgi:hypothetical protein